MRKTKIVATISSLNCDPALLKSLHTAGMDVARLNTAHMSLDEARKVIQNIRSVSDKIAILIDTKGPEIRTCDLANPRNVTCGEKITLGSSGSNADIPVNYAYFVREVPPLSRILIDDGAVELEVESKDRSFLYCQVISGEMIRNRKTVNVPGIELKLPAVSKKDREFIDFAIEQDLDFIAHSFVRGSGDVMAVQSILDTAESSIKVIAKIENRQGVERLNEILSVASGVMVARGDLGVEIPLEKVPQIQKEIIFECMRQRKPVITATQMLQSMEVSVRPTRAEVSDVANAVLDGTDAVMLSGETANGKYPLEAVKMMARTVIAAESIQRVHFTRASELDVRDNPLRGFVGGAAIHAAERLPVKAILCHSTSGDSARLCSAYRGQVPILALSHNARVVRQLALSFGVRPYLSEWCETSDELLRVGLESMVATGEVAENDLLAILFSYPADSTGTNLLSFLKPSDIKPKNR